MMMMMVMTYKNDAAQYKNYYENKQKTENHKFYFICVLMIDCCSQFDRWKQTYYHLQI